MKEKLKNTKGITLIALIITIIVLIILAMVSIKLVMDSDIITHANNAVTNYNTAQTNELQQLETAEAKMSEYAQEYAQEKNIYKFRDLSLITDWSTIINTDVIGDNQYTGVIFKNPNGKLAAFVGMYRGNNEFDIMLITDLEDTSAELNMYNIETNSWDTTPIIEEGATKMEKSEAIRKFKEITNSNFVYFTDEQFNQIFITE